MKNYLFILILFIIISNAGQSQNEGLEISGCVKDQYRTQEDVQLDFFEKNTNTLLYTIKTNPNGKFKQMLELDKEILLVVSHKSYLTLKFEFNTTLSEPKLRKKKYKFSMTIDLWQKFENIDYEVFDKPIAIIKYDYYEKEFLLDFDYFDKVYNRFMSKIRQTNYINKHENVYSNQIQLADSLMKLNKTEEARIAYHKAVNIRPFEEYPKKQIEIINNQYVSQKMVDFYKNTIELADSALKIGDKELAKNLFIKAVEIKPEENYPIDKLLAMDKEEKKTEEYEQILSMAEISYNNKVYNQALSYYEKLNELKPEESLPLEKIREIVDIIAVNKKKDAFNTAIEKGNQSLAIASYNQAIAFFEEAQQIFPDEKLPQLKIEEIKKIISNSNKSENYLLAISKGKSAFNEKNYEKALSYYNEALTLKPDENEPKEKISEIATLLAEVQKKDAYQIAISNADKAFELKMYDDAMLFYKEAQKYNPLEAYPLQKIEELNSLSEQKKKREKYENLIMDGNKMIEYKSYELARNKFNDALKLYPNEQYPKEKIVEINNLLTSRLKKDEYVKAIENGDQFFNYQSFTDALGYYQKALTLFPNEKYPQDRINEINNILNSKKKQSEYEQIVTSADQLFNQKKYESALTQYNKALLIFPDENYPQSKINEINIALAEIKKKQEFEKLVQEGDKYFAAKDYDNASSLYKQAASLFPNDDALSQKISITNKNIASRDKLKLVSKFIAEADNYYKEMDFAKAERSYKQALEYQPENNHAQQRINEISEWVKKANQLANQGNTAFTEGNFSKAISLYEDAMKLLPKDNSFKTKLSEINAKKDEYMLLVSKAEKAFTDSSLLLSASLLKRALKIKPNEIELKDKISKVNSIIAEMKTKRQPIYIVNLNIDKEVIKRGQSKSFSFDAITLDDKQKSSILLKIRNLNPEKSFDAILNYGINGQKNGGFYVTIAKGEATTEYIIPASSQPLWLSYDNNWFNLYSSTGDIEIHALKVVQRVD